MNSAKARQRADELEARLKRRLAELDGERQLSPMPPMVAGGPGRPCRAPGHAGRRTCGEVAADAEMRSATERAAVDAVLSSEHRLGRRSTEMPPNNKGYDIESRASDGTLLFIEVKGRLVGADTFTVTRSEIGVGRNQPDHHILALVAVDDGAEPEVRYLRRAFDDVGDLPFDSIGVNFKWKPYFERAQVPE